ncbi:hypothetical protein KM043_012365 [Ampulex compressa]|nr:hypothetical protein KM043_012365 [Ampulex compressa]
MTLSNGSFAPCKTSNLLRLDFTTIGKASRRLSKSFSISGRAFGIFKLFLTRPVVAWRPPLSGVSNNFSLKVIAVLRASLR